MVTRRGADLDGGMLLLRAHAPVRFFLHGCERRENGRDQGRESPPRGTRRPYSEEVITGRGTDPSLARRCSQGWKPSPQPPARPLPTRLLHHHTALDVDGNL